MSCPVSCGRSDQCLWGSGPKACSLTDGRCYQFTNNCLPDGYEPCPLGSGGSDALSVLCNQTVFDAGAPDAADSAPPHPGDAGGTPPTWVTIPKGSFTMGSPASEPCRQGNEDAHQVTLTHDFEIQTTEVTEGQFSALMGYLPTWWSKPCGSSCPMHEVTWHEAAAYCNALSKMAGKAPCYACANSMQDTSCTEAVAYVDQKIYACPGYRLPTEAEWEHAYRAGTQTAYYSGANDPGACTDCTANDANADKIAWYCGKNDIAPHPVEQKQPNAWGLHDMAGNVWEWCNDRYQESLGSAAVTDPWGAPAGADRVLRGGSWVDPATNLRAALRSGSPTGKPYYTHGFRCVRTTL